jgi:uncharacterized protein (DUF362 family)
MKPITRRDFLRTLAVSASALALPAGLAGCQPAPMDETTPLFTDTPSASPTSPLASQAAATPDQPVPTGAASSTGAPAGAFAGASAPHLAVARSGEPAEMVRRAVAALGGMQRFVPKDSSVIIKPNICTGYHSYEYAATTNPWVVAALVSLCLEAGARTVQVMDFPFGGTAAQAYEKSGIAEQVRLAGGEMVEMARFKFLPTDIPAGRSLKQAEIYDDILNAGVLINVPIAKHHSLARLTLGMKNLMGVIQDRSAIHQDLGQRLADLSSRVRPALTVVDAVRMLMAHGPTGGQLEDVYQTDTVIASADVVAADSYAATLFGLQPGDLDYVRCGAEMGLGSSDLASLRIEEINVGR